MKKIEKIYILSSLEKIKYIYVVYKDFSVKRFAATQDIDNIYNDLINKFKKQESLTKEELIKKDKIINKEYSLKKVRKLNEFSRNSNSYSAYNNLNIFSFKASISLSLIGIILNHFIAFGMDLIGILPFVLNAIFTLPYVNFDCDLKKTISSRKSDKFQLKKSLAFTLYLISLIDCTNLPITNLSYYYDVMNTDIESSNEFDNVSKEEYHTLMVDKIFNDLSNNPYLREEDLNTLLKLKQYYLENLYIDYDYLYKTMMMLTVRYKYKFGGDGVVGSTINNSHIINCYPNCYASLDNEDVLLHEAIHKTGSLNNRILDEGMTSLIAAEYFDLGKVENGYAREVLVTKMFCEILGSDLMLEAYSTQNDDMVNDGLMNIYKHQKVVDSIYYLMEKYVDSTNEEVDKNFSNLFLVLVNEAPQDIQLIVYNEIVSATQYDNAYFSDYYKIYCKAIKSVNFDS